MACKDVSKALASSETFEPDDDDEVFRERSDVSKALASSETSVFFGILGAAAVYLSGVSIVSKALASSETFRFAGEKLLEVV